MKINKEDYTLVAVAIKERINKLEELRREMRFMDYNFVTIIDSKIDRLYLLLIKLETEDNYVQK